MDERKSWMIIAGFVCGFVGLILAFTSGAEWSFALGLLILAVGMFFTVMGIRSGMKHRNKTLADGLLILVVVFEMGFAFFFLTLI